MPPLTEIFTFDPSHSVSVATQWSKAMRAVVISAGREMDGDSSTSTPASVSAPQLPTTTLGTNMAEPDRLPGRLDWIDQSGASKVDGFATARVVAVQPEDPLSQSCSKIVLGALPLQSAGAFASRRAAKEHGVSSRSSVASIASVTAWQSAEVMAGPVLPQGPAPVVSSKSGVPIRSVHEVSSAVARS